MKLAVRGKGMLLRLLDEQELSYIEVAKQLDISTSQLYRWNKNGISQNSKYYEQLKEIIPNLKPKEEKLKKDGSTDLRTSNPGKTKKTKLTLYETDLQAPPEERDRMSDFPKIVFRKKQSSK